MMQFSLDVIGIHLQLVVNHAHTQDLVQDNVDFYWFAMVPIEASFSQCGKYSNSLSRIFGKNFV